MWGVYLGKDHRESVRMAIREREREVNMRTWIASLCACEIERIFDS